MLQSIKADPVVLHPSEEYDAANGHHPMFCLEGGNRYAVSAEGT